MPRLFLILSFVFSYSIVFSQIPGKKEIMSEMDRQMKCWNDGDLDCFMEGYWKSDSLMFIGKSGINYGWQSTYERYQKTYPDRATMGTLKFEIKEVKEISDDTVFMVGGWHLTRESGNIGGHFTLIWKKIDDQWVIISDHTS